MNFNAGSIILIKNYPLRSKIKDKFFIVLHKDENEINLLSMTTSQIYFNSTVKHGLIKEGDASFYCFGNNKTIGQNGFCFKKDTIVSNRMNIHQFANERLSQYDIEYKDCLKKEELINLIYSFYQYKGVAKKHKKTFGLNGQN